MKKFLMNYLKYRLHRLVEAQSDLLRDLCLYGENDTICQNGLRLTIALEEIKFECYKSLLPNKWIEFL